MATEYSRQKLNLLTPNGYKLELFQNSNSTGAFLESHDGAHPFTLDASKIVLKHGGITQIPNLVTLLLDQETRLDEAKEKRDELEATINANKVIQSDGDSTLLEEINAEVTRALSAEAALSVAINAEQSRATTAEQANAALVSAETTRATAAEETNAAAISAEAARATAAEQANATAISNILSGSTVNLDSLSELVAAYESADSDLQTLINSLTTRMTVLENIVNEALVNPASGEEV